MFDHGPFYDFLVSFALVEFMTGVRKCLSINETGGGGISHLGAIGEESPEDLPGCLSGNIT